MSEKPDHSDPFFDDALEEGMKIGFGGPADTSSVLSALAPLLGDGAPQPIPVPEMETEGVITPETRRGLAQAGRYRVMGEIAKGGVGVVLRARDMDLGRDVAVKVLRVEHEDRTQVINRFIEEAQIGGQLQHPGIVPVYEMGLVADERPYFAMKLVKGDTLAALLDQRSGVDEELRQFLSTFSQICHTIAYAHARGVIHRDLKPSNVMVGAFGEVQVVDWGFAKVLAQGGVADEKRSARRRKKRPQSTVVRTVRTGSSGSESQPGSVMGTPAYMPQEQALGEVEKIDERSDVFMLGAILCETLTGSPPYLGDTREALLSAARADLADALSRLDACRADPALVDLCRRCLDPERRKRPRDASEVARGIEDHLQSVERRAREARIEAAEARERAEGEKKSRRLILGIATVLFVTVVGVIGGVAWVRGREADRVRAATGIVTAELETAARLRGEAEARFAAGDPHDRVRTAWSRVRKALDRATQLAAADEMDPATRAWAAGRAEVIATAADAVEARIAAMERERALLSRLEDARYGAVEGSVRGLAYEAAFRDFGLDITELGREEIVRRLRTIEDPEVLQEVISALDDWSDAAGAYGYTPSGPSRRLFQIVEELDEDETRCAIRQAAVRRQKRTLLDIAFGNGGAELEGTAPNLLARHLDRLASPEEASSFLQTVQRLRPADFATNLQLGRILYQLDPRPLGEIASYLRAAFAARPDCLPVRMLLGAILYEWGNEDGALEVWLGGLRQNPALFLQWPEALETVRESGRLDGILAVLAREAEAAADGASVRVVYAAALEVAGRYEASAREYERIAENEAPDPQFALQAAAAWLRAGNSEAAFDVYARVPEVRREDVAFHEQLADALLDRGRVADAIRTYRRVVDILPARAEPRLRLGIALSRLGKQSEAQNEFLRARELSDRDAETHYRIGLNFLRLGDHRKAEHSFRQAVQLRDDLPDAERRLGFLLLARSDEEAIEHLMLFHALNSWPDGAEYSLDQWQSDVAIQSDLVGLIVDALHGDVLDLSPREHLLFARLCYEIARYGLAAEAFARAFDADRELAGERAPYGEPVHHAAIAARSAALASAGRGRDGASRNAADAARWRQLGIRWLRWEAALWKQDSGDRGTRQAALRSLCESHYGLSPFQVGEGLSEKERVACRAAMDELRQLLVEESDD